ncbi:Trp biosynthesis-associated membrane protein [Homoserinibacter sp. GY 40078]|uniref:Trp biosynthesis-associated membrane protein n=1 Tax=Homoserinibacter sp. GY 40078 TaxID=2603275 RepID=UPI0011CC43DA|nr:Trp biosynthesis-associated membrane protein [Homoserinibacter sp. GY 40078]TXK17561.1 Trp biosynthesis-associated membrane protein [Homoserinibacter sp. GY 40078]
MTASRIRGVLLGALVLAAAALLLAWSQTWYTVMLVPESGETAPLTVGGDVAAGGLAPLALTTLALVAALALAGPVFRILLGVLGALLGVAIVAAVLVTVSDPVDASAPTITDALGVSGEVTIAGLVAGTEATAWPVVAVVFGVVVSVLGVLVALTARRWPTGGRRYSRTRTVIADPEAEPDPIAEWDALSDGDDPTTPAR